MARLFLFSQIFIRKRLLPIYLFLSVIACSQPEDVDFSKQKNDVPSRTVINANVIFKDSGFLKINLRSPRIEEYALIDSPYTKFPKGLEMDFYNKNIDSPGFLKANWAIMNELKGWYEGRGDVLVINEKGDTLKTQKLFWDKKKRRIFTQDTVFLISKSGDSLQANNGLEAKDDLSEYSLFNNRGMKLYEEEKF